MTDYPRRLSRKPSLPCSEQEQFYPSCLDSDFKKTVVRPPSINHSPLRVSITYTSLSSWTTGGSYHCLDPSLVERRSLRDINSRNNGFSDYYWTQGIRTINLRFTKVKVQRGDTLFYVLYLTRTPYNFTLSH